MLSSKSFYEEQKHPVWVLILVLFATGISLGFTFYGLIQQLVYGEPFGENPMSDEGLIVLNLFILLITFGVLLYIFGSRLKVRVEGKVLTAKYSSLFFPEFSIGPDKLKSWEISAFRPFVETRGYGYRLGLKKKTIIMRGKHVLKLKPKEGKELWLSTEKPLELKAAMEEQFPKEQVNG